MKLIIEIPVLKVTGDAIGVGHIATVPFEYDSVDKLQKTLKTRTEKLIKLNGNSTQTDYSFTHSGYSLDLRRLIHGGKYEAPDIMTVAEYFKSHKKGA